MKLPLQRIVGDVAQKNAFDFHGTIEDELKSADRGFSPANVHLLKHHGVFQHDNRDLRNRQGGPRRYEFMVRIRTTGGILSAWQFRSLLDLSGELGDSVLRITSRQGIQLSGIEKNGLRPVLRCISDLKLTTFATGGDFFCNIMCCPALGTAANDDIQTTAVKLDALLTPRVRAYDEIWQTDRSASRLQSSQKNIEAPDQVLLLPQKFKIGLAFPNDNCTEVLAQDLGLQAVTEGGRVVGYNVVVGGNLRNSLSVAGRSSTLAKPLAFIAYDDTVPLVGAIVAVFREFGNRSDHRRARMRYLIQDWGIDRFKQVVEDRHGPLDPPLSIDVAGHNDHLGWQRQDNSKWSLGIHVNDGCVTDNNDSRLKSALREITQRIACSIRLTAQRNVMLVDIDSSDRLQIYSLLSHHAVQTVGTLSNVRRFSTSCPGLPNCSSAITESHRILPGIIAELEAEISRLGLDQQRFTLGMAGCSFGCARCFLADIAIVGRTLDRKTKQGKYAIFLGGDRLGRRLNTLYKDQVPEDQIMATLRPLLARFRRQHLPSESLGDYFLRVGIDVSSSWSE